MITIRLPYPPAKLSPNARLHWAAKAKVVKQYRRDCGILTKVSDAPYRVVSRWNSPRLPIKITFHPPDKRRRDRDNMIASFKAGADGVADAIGVDDADWEPTYAVGDVIKGGAVIVEIDV